MEDHAEGEGEHSEVDLHVPHAERPDRYRDEPAEHRRADQDHLERTDLSMGGEERPGVRADPDEQRMTEGDEARIPEEEVQPEQDDRVGHERQHEQDVVGRGDERCGGDGSRRHHHDQAPLHAAAPPKRPRGRATSTAITIR